MTSLPLSKVSARFSETVIDGETIVMNLDDGNFFSLSGTGQAIWNLIDGQRNRQAILDELYLRFNAAAGAIADDLDVFIDQLLAAGLIAIG